MGDDPMHRKLYSSNGGDLVAHVRERLIDFV
jgi:hypothetical protein